MSGYSTYSCTTKSVRCTMEQPSEYWNPLVESMYFLLIKFTFSFGASSTKGAFLDLVFLVEPPCSVSTMPPYSFSCVSYSGVSPLNTSLTGMVIFLGSSYRVSLCAPDTRLDRPRGSISGLGTTYLLLDLLSLLAARSTSFKGASSMVLSTVSIMTSWMSVANCS
jgi:hypothetical protein